MAKKPDRQLDDRKRRPLVLEQFLLVICLCVLAVRATNAEAVNIAGVSPWMHVGEDLASLIFTSILFGCALLWFVTRIVRKTFVYRFTGIELPALLFIIAGLIGIAIAADKRAALNDYVTMVAPILAAVMLVQIFDSDSKIRLVLAVIVALACVSAWRCWMQFSGETQMMIDQYKANPESMLRPLGLTAGSFEAWLFEHRLYTKGVTGFLTTSNSVASFSILAAFAAVALFLEKSKAARRVKRLLPPVMTAAALIAVLLNFLFVRSKGGTAAFVFALILFVLLLRFGKFTARHRGKLLILALLCAVAIAAVTINYGIKHGRLPGGNSMLVRWQYWTAAVKMYAAHPFAGVGPGNFNSYYPQYKTPAALETVKDPHDFLLSILTQYGPLGLAAFLAMLFIPFWSALQSQFPADSGRPAAPPLSRRSIIIFVITIATVLLIVRPILNPPRITDEPLLAVVYVLLTLYVMPAVLFLLAFILAWAFAHRCSSRLTSVTVKALFCACIGLYIHNTIDFAIFEPGIYTTLWVSIACLIALNHVNQNAEPRVRAVSPFARIAVLAVLAVAVWAFCHYALFPVARSTSSLRRAQSAYNDGMLDRTQQLLKTAAQQDKFNPRPNLTIATLYLQYRDYYGPNQDQVLRLAEQYLLTAAKQDPADFKPYEMLTNVYTQLADKSSGRAKVRWLQKLFDAASGAVNLYPGSARMRIDLADVAEKLNKTDVAFANYKKAVEIEDAYRKQFETMYPNTPLFSRLGQDNYEYAKHRIAELESH